MKRGALDHPKTLELNARLNESLRATWGLLEALVHYTNKYAPAGDIGKWTDASIAKGLGWDGDPAELIAALVETRWLETGVPGVRLLVHDWPEHADDAVHAQLARAGRLFADGSLPKLTRLTAEERKKCAEKLQTATAAREAALTSAAYVAAERLPCARHALDEQQSCPPPSSPVPPSPAGASARAQGAPADVPPAAKPSGSDGWKREYGVHEWDWPFIEAWIARFELPPDRLGDFCAGFDPIRGTKPRPEALERWGRYLDPALNREKPQFLHSRKFVATYGAWASGVPILPAREKPSARDKARDIAADWAAEEVTP